MSDLSKVIFVAMALLPEGWRHNVKIRINSSGFISEVIPDATPEDIESKDNTLVLTDQVMLPAIANVHSHTFQRAMAGLAELCRDDDDDDNFWSWRQLMYKVANQLEVWQVRAIAAMAFCEMLETGFASVGEFHYIHHQPGGDHYDNIAEVAINIIAGAITSGIGLTLLPVLYSYGDVTGAELAPRQKRFANSLADFDQLVDKTQVAINRYGHQAGYGDYTLGIAPHSLRAVSKQQLRHLTATYPRMITHIHISEQPLEVKQIVKRYQQTPVNWLTGNFDINHNWTLIHATHTTPAELATIAASGAVVGLCPLTEANLGDGVFNLPAFQRLKGTFAIGSDSNINISLIDELQMLEYSQRLVNSKRCLASGSTTSTGHNLYQAAASGGSISLGRSGGGIGKNNRADLITLDLNTFDWRHNIFDQWLFTNRYHNRINNVWSAGRWLVQNGQHIRRQTITRHYKQAISELAVNL